MSEQKRKVNQNINTHPILGVVEKLKSWVGEINPYMRDAVKFEYSISDDNQALNFNDGTIRFYFYTEAHLYDIVATPKYLGCTATNRKPYVGETWARGRDLPDGPFEKDTWDRILKSIAANEIQACISKMNWG